ncbi:MAG TPA: glycosyl hydrolase [Opitutaceae bacterium]|nr:glycosyl hydrolase [Opitutaceae bacterium]
MAAHAQNKLQRFGVMTHFAQGWDPALTPLVAQASIGSVRDELYWDVVEAKKGKYVFPPRYENYMKMLREQQISPLIVLSFENRNYDSGQTPYTNEGFNGYADYAVNVLSHYGKQIEAVEVWNEYNGSFCKGPATHDRADTYLKMLKTAYTRIKETRPDVMVAGGATIGIPSPYWEELLANGALSSMDVVSVHPYRYNTPPEGLENEIAGLETMIKKYNRGQPKPIWVTEIGWGTKKSEAPGDLSIDETTQAKFLVRAYALLLSAHVERVYWYLLRDYEHFSMGLLHEDQKRTPKKDYTAMATMTRQIGNAEFIQRESSSFELYSLLFKDPSGKDLRIVWSLKPITISANGVVDAVDMLGAEIKDLHRLQIGDAPIFVSGPLTGLPPAEATMQAVLADSNRDFGATQGGNGWSYGIFLDSGTNFTALQNFNITDWKKEWTGIFPYLSITSNDQHPSTDGTTPVVAVRRWESNYDGEVRLSGEFRCSTQGDGVGVRILVDGEALFRKIIGGGNSIVEKFDVVRAIKKGTRIDFAVDPGPGENIDYDATNFSVTISANSS